MRQAETSTSSTRVPKTTRTIPPSPQTRRSFFQWPVIGLLLALAAFFGFEAIHASREPAREKVTFRSSPDVRFINGVPFRPIETYRPCDRVLGHNPELTDEDRADFGPEPDPATWKLLTLRAPKTDGGFAEVSMVESPEWLAEHQPAVGRTVPIWVPECGIEGMAEVLAIGRCRPVKPGKGPVVLATFRHHVASTVKVHISGLAEPIGCTGNHPFWSVDRQDFVRADELREGERLDGFGPDARVKRVALDGQPEVVFNILVQGEHVYRVSEAGVLVHNALPIPCPRNIIPKEELVASAKRLNTLQELSRQQRALEREIEFLESKIASIERKSLEQIVKGRRGKGGIGEGYNISKSKADLSAATSKLGEVIGKIKSLGGSP
jgi:hypothetical protein